VLEERLAGLARQVEAIDGAVQEIRKESVAMLVELKVLQTRVGLYAAGISVAVSIASGVLQKFVN
jgi:regulator of replication initiation timing